ncbi:MAG: tetratricopeptide repeat protein, partial [Candidatus Thermoplasmatota archaeon]|nr:tetratricopeptide repeat protein [Candidatus Thermoplasmatota archaeon]
PKSVEGILQDRLSTMDGKERKVMEACAILGPVIPFPPLAKMTGLPEEELIEVLETLMEKANLVQFQEEDSVWGDEEYSFPSTILFKTTYEAIPEEKRAELHIMAAKALEWYSSEAETLKDDLMPAMARHYTLGGEFGRALPLFIGAGKRAESLSAYSVAEQLYAEAAELMESKIGLPPSVYTRTLLDASRMAIITGDVEKGNGWLETAVSTARKNGLRRMEIEGRIYMGEIEMERENFLKAENISLETLQDAVLMGDIEHIGWCFERLGLVYWRLGKLKQAKDFLQNGLAYSHASGDKIVTGKIDISLGNLFISQGEPDKAMEYYNKALNIMKASGRRYEEARIYNNMGFAHRLQGETEESLKMYREAVRLAKEIGALKILGLAYQGMAETSLEKGEVEQAEKYVFRAMDIVDIIGKRFYTIRCYIVKGLIAETRGEKDTAEILLENAVEIAEDIKVAQEKGEALLNLGRFYKRTGNDKHLKTLDEAERIAKLMGNKWLLDQIRAALENGQGHA